MRQAFETSNKITIRIIMMVMIIMIITYVVIVIIMIITYVRCFLVVHTRICVDF